VVTAATVIHQTAKNASMMFAQAATARKIKNEKDFIISYMEHIIVRVICLAAYY
jgi:hypothetical protein